MLEIFKELFQSNIINAAVDDVASVAQGMAFSLAIFFAVMHLPIVGIQSVVMMKRPKEILQMKAGNLVLITLVFAYSSFMSPIEAMVNTCAKMSAPSIEKAGDYYDHLHAVYFVRKKKGNITEQDLAELDEDAKEKVKKQIEVIQQTGEMPKPVGNEDTDFFDVLTESAGIVGEFFLNAIVGAVITIIKGLAVGITLVLLKLLYIVGPLAIAFSILPPFREKAMVWFGTYLTIALNLVTLNFIDMLFYDILIGKAVALQHGHSVDVLATSTFNLVLIVAYIMSFWLTSKWVGSESAGRFMTAAMGMAANVAKKALMTAFGGKGGGGGGSGGGNSISMVTDTIKDGLKKGNGNK